MRKKPGFEICVCGDVMTFVGNLKYYHVHSCPFCYRLLMRSRNSGHHAMFSLDSSCSDINILKKLSSSGG